MTTRTEKVRKLRALARDKGAFANESAVALAKAQALEFRTAKAIARAIGQLLEARGMQVRVRRRGTEERWSRVDVDVRYFCSRSRYRQPHQIMIEVTEYE